MYPKTWKIAAVVACLTFANGSTSATPKPQPFWEGQSFAGARQLPNTFMLLENGERVGAWRTVGQRGNVAWMSGSYVHHGFNFLAESKNHPTTDTWINLAGISQSATGIAHGPVPTTVGAQYTLTFYVGNLYDPGGIYGTSSTVAVYANQMPLGTFTNSNGEGSKNENWKPFSITFTATDKFTVIAFINGDPPGDMNCGLDEPVLAPTPSSPKEAAR